MSVSTPAPIRRAIADDRLLEAARTRRRLLDTALSATGGESVRELREDDTDPRVWHAVVHHAGGHRVQVRLDTRLGTVVVREGSTGDMRAA